MDTLLAILIPTSTTYTHIKVCLKMANSVGIICYRKTPWKCPQKFTWMQEMDSNFKILWGSMPPDPPNGSTFLVFQPVSLPQAPPPLQIPGSSPVQQHVVLVLWVFFADISTVGVCIATSADTTVNCIATSADTTVNCMVLQTSVSTELSCLLVLI